MNPMDPYSGAATPFSYGGMAMSDSSMQLNMQQMQAHRMMDMQLRVSQMQADMVRSMERLQLSNMTQMPFPGMMSRAFGGFGAPGFPGRPGMTVPSQSFGSLLADAGLSRTISNLTGGLLLPGYAMQFGASRAVVMQRAEDELYQRFDDFTTRAITGAANFATFGLSDFFLNRSSLAFMNERGTTARNVANRFAALRTGLAGDQMGVDGRGVRLRSNFVQGLTSDVQRSLTDLHRMRGFSMTREDYSNLENAIFDSMNAGERERLVRMDTAGRSQFIEQRRNDVVELTRALGLNTAQVAALTKDMNALNISNKELVQISRTGGRGNINIDMTREQEADARARLMLQGRGMDLGIGRAFSSGQFASATLLFDRLRGQNREAEMGRFGGTGMEAAMNYQAEMYRIGAGMTPRIGAAVAFGGFLGEGGTVGLAQTMGRIYGQDPLAALRLRLDPNARNRAALLNPLAAYRQVMADAERFGQNNLLSRPEMLASRFAQMAGVELERAPELMETFRRSDSEFQDLAARLSGASRTRISAAELTNFQQKAAAAGVAISKSDLEKYDPEQLIRLIKAKSLTQSEYFDVASMPGGTAPAVDLENMDPQDPRKGLMLFQGYAVPSDVYTSLTNVVGPGITSRLVAGTNAAQSAAAAAMGGAMPYLGAELRQRYLITGDAAHKKQRAIEEVNRLLQGDARFAGISGADIVTSGGNTGEELSASLENLYERGTGMTSELLKRRVSALTDVYGDSEAAKSARGSLVQRLAAISRGGTGSFNLNQIEDMLTTGKGDIYSGFDTPEERQQLAAELNQFANKAIANSAPEAVLIDNFGNNAKAALTGAFVDAFKQANP